MVSNFICLSIRPPTRSIFYLFFTTVAIGYFVVLKMEKENAQLRREFQFLLVVYHKTNVQRIQGYEQGRGLRQKVE